MTFNKSLIASAISAVILTGCNIKPGEVQLTDPLGDVTFKNGKTMSLDTGFGSGAFHMPGDKPNVFYTVTDRGPNIKCSDAEKLIGDKDFCGGDTKAKIFPQPDYSPTIYKLWVGAHPFTGQLRYRVLEKIKLKDSYGKLISGVVNPLTVTDTENGYGPDQAKLPFDPNGLDVEGIVRLSDGSFWLADEYGPSIVHVASNGNIIERIVPETMAADLAGASYSVKGMLPEILKKRKLNRGAESVAVSPDENALYFAMQSPLANPAAADYKTSRNVRIFKLELVDGKVTKLLGEYVYTMDDPQTFANLAEGKGDLKGGKVRKQSDVKVSEMMALAEDDLIVLERISKVTKLYRINLKAGQNILGSELDDMATSPSLENYRDTAVVNARPVPKKLVFNSMTDVEPGTLPKKVEGIAKLDDTHLLLVNDNDFGIAGDPTKAVILPIAAELSKGDLPQARELAVEGSYHSGVFDKSAAEIVDYDATNQRIFVVNAKSGLVDVLDASTPSAPALLTSINVKAAAPDLGAANSVAYKNGLIAVAIEAATKQNPGLVAVYNADDFSLAATFTVGALPDMLTFTPDGSKIIVANEGEPNDDYSIDPEGSISIIDLSMGIQAATVNPVGFANFNIGGVRHGELPADVRIFGPGASVAQDLEPEYVAVSKDSKTAWVSLQENNAIAVVDLMAGKIKTIAALGFKDHGLAGNGLDASDKDDKINIKSWKHVLGMYQPDAIAAYEWRGKSFIVSGNEGDAREYKYEKEVEGQDEPEEIVAYTEEERAGKLALDTVAFPDDVKNKANLGRLTVTTTLGKNGDSYDKLYAFGARSFSIWDEQGRLVFDSAADFERITAEHLPKYFNASDKPKFDNRSDNKGPEPEGVAVGTIGDTTYAFVGLERIGGVMVYDISNPYGAQFVQYINNRDFSVDPETKAAGDIGPEGLKFVAGADMLDGVPRLIVGNEVSGSTTIYRLENL